MQYPIAVRSLLAMALLGGGTAPAFCQLTSRATFLVRGDAVIIGNTLAQDAAAGVPAPVVGTVGFTGSNTTDTAPDVFWRSNSPTTGNAEASVNISLAQARSTAALALSAGQQVRYARLYWAATTTDGVADPTVSFTSPNSVTTTVTADATYTSTNFSYLGTADVTSLMTGNGGYTVSGVNGVDLINRNDNNAFTGWGLVVVYESPALPNRFVEIADGLAVVNGTTSASYTFSGFLVPAGGFTSSLSVLAFETDATVTGDSLSVDGNVYSDAQNAAMNFFNSTHSRDGAAVSNSGDLPRLTGAVNSMSGVDIDEIHPVPTAGQTSRTVSAQTTPGGDVLYLGALVHSISTLSVSITGIEHLASGDVRVTGQSDAGSVLISGSSSPTDGFVSLGRVSTSGLTFTFTDTTAGSAARRFYRASIP